MFLIMKLANGPQAIEVQMSVSRNLGPNRLSSLPTNTILNAGGRKAMPVYRVINMSENSSDDNTNSSLVGLAIYSESKRMQVRSNAINRGSDQAYE